VQHSPKKERPVQNERPISRRVEQDKNAPIRLDWSIIQARMTATGIKTMDDFEVATGLGRTTLFNAKRDLKCSQTTFEAIMNGLKVGEDQLRRQPITQELSERTNALIPPNGWAIESIESEFLVAANGVSYRVCKLKREVMGQPIRYRYSRAKYYDTLHAAPAMQPEYAERLNRHAAVCSSLPKGTKVPQHYDIRKLAEDSAWWVLDEWIPSVTLATMIDNRFEWTSGVIHSVGLQLLETLSVLHSHRCIVRELTPERILMEENSTNCYITDFEMARMLDSDISVSGKWSWTTHYRAPEVNDNDAYWQSDLYSWAMIMVELFSGSPKNDEGWIQSHAPTAAIAKLLTQCLDKRYHHRPASIDSVMKVWQKWSGKP